MYSATLKQSPPWKAQVSLLASPPTQGGLNLRASQIETHDLTIPFPPTPRTNTRRTLRVLLLTPEDIRTTTKDTTLSRLDRFAHTTGGSDLCIILLIHSIPDASQPYAAYSTLQLLVRGTSSLRGIPILPLAQPSALVPTIKQHMTALLTPPPMPPPIPTLELLRYCTASASTRQLSSSAVNVVSDVVGSFRELMWRCLEEGQEYGEEGRASREGLEALVADEEREGLYEFWKGEWVIE